MHHANFYLAPRCTGSVFGWIHDNICASWLCDKASSNKVVHWLVAKSMLHAWIRDEGCHILACHSSVNWLAFLCNHMYATWNAYLVDDFFFVFHLSTYVLGIPLFPSLIKSEQISSFVDWIFFSFIFLPLTHLWIWIAPKAYMARHLSIACPTKNL